MRLRAAARGKNPVGWKRPFDDPIDLPGGRKLVTLEDAGNYITELPKAEHSAPEWQAAMQALMLVARGGPTMFARIGVMRALPRRYRPRRIVEFRNSRPAALPGFQHQTSGRYPDPDDRRSRDRAVPTRSAGARPQCPSELPKSFANSTLRRAPRHPAGKDPAQKRAITERSPGALEFEIGVRA
jgi:hypothetical protein